MIDAYIALIIFILFMVITPGPANMVLMIGGAQKGVRACFGFIIGVIFGKILLNLLFGFGFFFLAILTFSYQGGLIFWPFVRLFANFHNYLEHFLSNFDKKCSFFRKNKKLQ